MEEFVGFERATYTVNTVLSAPQARKMADTVLSSLEKQAIYWSDVNLPTQVFAAMQKRLAEGSNPSAANVQNMSNTPYTQPATTAAPVSFSPRCISLNALLKICLTAFRVLEVDHRHRRWARTLFDAAGGGITPVKVNDVQQLGIIWQGFEAVMKQAKPVFDTREIESMWLNYKYKGPEPQPEPETRTRMRRPSISSRTRRPSIVSAGDKPPVPALAGPELAKRGWVLLPDFLRLIVSLLAHGTVFELQKAVLTRRLTLYDEAVNLIIMHWTKFQASVRLISELASVEMNSSGPSPFYELELAGDASLEADSGGSVISNLPNRGALQRHNQAFLSLAEHLQHLLEKEMADYRLLPRSATNYEQLADSAAKRMVALYRSLLYVILSHQSANILAALPLVDARVEMLHSELQVLEHMCVKQHKDIVAAALATDAATVAHSGGNSDYANLALPAATLASVMHQPLSTLSISRQASVAVAPAPSSTPTAERTGSASGSRGGASPTAVPMPAERGPAALTTSGGTPSAQATTRPVLSLQTMGEFGEWKAQQ